MFCERRCEQVCLKPPEAAGGAVSGAAAARERATTADLVRMLGRRHSRVDAGKALRLFPDEARPAAVPGRCSPSPAALPAVGRTDRGPALAPAPRALNSQPGLSAVAIWLIHGRTWEDDCGRMVPLPVGCCGEAAPGARPVCMQGGAPDSWSPPAEKGQTCRGAMSCSR